MNATPQMLRPAESEKLAWAERYGIRTIAVAMVFVAIAATYVQWYPYQYWRFTVEDSGIFLHVGQRLLSGDLLYRDIADNKPPLIYWVNALGLLLGRGSPGGVLLLCMVSGLLTYAVLYWGLRRHVTRLAFVISACLGQLAFLTCAKHPNYTEAFALPLVGLAAVLFVREILEEQTYSWVPLAQGLIAGLLFSWRPNNIGISLIYVAYMMVNTNPRRWFRRLFLFGVAALATYALILTPLLIQGTATDYRIAALQQASAYAGENGLLSRVAAAWHGVNLFVASPLLYFGLASGATVLLSRRSSNHIRLTLWLAIWLALEMALSSTSGYRWDHYYLLWIPPLMLMLMLVGPLAAERVNPVLSAILAAAFVLVLLNQAVVTTYRALTYPRDADPAVGLARAYMREGDRVTTWGYFTHDLWFQLNHQPGTRLFHEGEYTNREIYRALVPAFLGDLEKNLPRVVVERRSVVPLFAPARPDKPLNSAFLPRYFTAWDDAAIVKRKAELAQRYRPVIEEAGVVVFLRRD